MAKAGRYMWRSRGKVGSFKRVLKDAYTGASFAEKREYQARRAGATKAIMYQCRLCPVKVLERDREGHIKRNHNAAGSVLVVFTVVRNAK